MSLERTVVAPIVFFLAIYFGTFALFFAIVRGDDVRAFHLPGLAAVLAASVATSFLFRDRDSSARAERANGLAAMRDFARGSAIAVVVVGVAQLVIAATPALDVHAGTGFPFSLWLTLIVPGVVHEELLMRGTIFARLARFSPSFALFSTSTLFALLHLFNSGITFVALLNIVLGGALLGFSRLSSGSVVQPIALHLTWNTLIGPLFGDEVSGFAFPRALLRETDRGPEILTGGSFGLEGSLVLTAVLAIAVVGSAMRLRRAAEPD